VETVKKILLEHGATALTQTCEGVNSGMLAFPANDLKPGVDIGRPILHF
jgi:hypothetical protein